MASGGPIKLSSDVLRKFQAILKLPVGAEKTKQIQALSATEKDDFRTYTDFLKQKQLEQKREAELAAARLRQQELQDQLAALQLKEQDLSSREVELLREDRSILTQASSSYAPKVAAVQTTVPKEPATGSAPRYGSKFNQ